MEDPDSIKLSTWTEFSQETKRWSVYGIALNHVLVPSIRPILEETVLKEYSSLESKHRMNGHSFNGVVVPIGVNHTKSDAKNKKKHIINFNDKITSHIEYAKLFLKKDMRDFSAFDETCDASVVLCLFGKIGSFPAALRSAANLVQKGRDIWVHYKPSEWNDDDFQNRFHDMKQLVEEVGFSPSDKCKVLEDLNTYKRRGFGRLSSESFLTRSHKIDDHVTKVSNHVPISNFICHLTNRVVQHYTINSIPINTESPNVAEQKIISQLLNSTSEIKVIFAETLHSLDLLESYLKCPSEEAALPLKRLFDGRKCSYTKPLTPDEIEGFLEISRSLLVTRLPIDKESDEPKDCDQYNCISGNGNLGSDFNSQPNSISPPLSPNYESRKNNLEDRNFNGNEIPSENVVNSCGHYNSENAFKCKDDFAQASLESKAETETKDFACSDEHFNGQQCDEAKKDKKSESKVFSNFSAPQIKKVRQRKGIRGQIGYSGDEKKMTNEKISKVNALKSRNSPNFLYPSALLISPREKELEDENLSLKKKVKSLKIQNEEILVELGQITFEKTAKENEEKRSEYFRQVFHSSLHEDKRSGTSNSRNDRSNNDLNQQSSDPNDSLRHSVTSRSPNPPILNGAEALVQENNLQPNNDKKVTNDEKQREFPGGNHESASSVGVNSDQQTATVQNTPSVQSGEESSGGEETNEFRGSHDQASISRNGYDDLSFSVQQHDSGREYISLSNVPPTSVATTLYNNYKFLLLSLAQNLLSSDVVMLQDWAAQNFSISNPRNATDILLQLDQKGVINASDLHQLSEFFESIIRFDLVHIIDAFLLGDYNFLRQSQASRKHAENLVQNHGHRAILRNPGFSNAGSTRQFSINSNRTLGTSRKPANNNGAQNALPQTQPQSLRNFSDTANSAHFVSSVRNQPMASTQSNIYKPATGFNSIKMAEVAVGGGGVTNERRTTSGNAGTRTTPSGSNGAGSTPTVSSNGSKLSKFQHPDRERSNGAHWDPDSDGNWLCSHYKRHCYVKFDCCDKFWPCHRCHNNQSTCGRKKLKSRDTRVLKCVYCNKVQQFGEHCCNCGAKFANYFCGLCKHLTGKDDHPYHCEKCGICRIHGDRSFHCDVCGVCLDVQLRGNHKCREGSAHDECCICLEDAFTGCQILPCSHKVHKECATQMIRSGITRCPICRESFAHKLERRPQDSRKRPGK